jgi:hypothetical protein
MLFKGTKFASYIFHLFHWGCAHANLLSKEKKKEKITQKSQLPFSFVQSQLYYCDIPVPRLDAGNWANPRDSNPMIEM